MVVITEFGESNYIHLVLFLLVIHNIVLAIFVFHGKYIHNVRKAVVNIAI